MGLLLVDVLMGLSIGSGSRRLHGLGLNFGLAPCVGTDVCAYSPTVIPAKAGIQGFTAT
ncbi:hypothetical protein LC55x_1218 [Lysobacter capsici]|nr:hypothetical protein LC55x_1218 [Lysobacter capsici]